jgi:hypothetical protein
MDILKRSACVLSCLSTAMATSLPAEAKEKPEPPIILRSSGGFLVGGRVVTDPKNAANHLSCDHGYVEYFLPEHPRVTSLVMWHSSSTQVWQNRWDGGEGFKDMFLRQGYPVYLWDGPRVGRANWGCEAYQYTPQFRDEFNFVAWNFGPSYKSWWPDVQFPVTNENAWRAATAARYQEFDALKNIELETDAAATAADSGKLGKSIVYLTNSAGGLRALLTATKSGTRNIAGIVAYESAGFVFPDGDPKSPAPCSDPEACPFGPVIVPAEQFKKLARLAHIQFVWGDHRDDPKSIFDLWLKQSKICAELINKYGGKAEVVMLGEQGLKGNTHIPFADMNNAEVAKLLMDMLKRAKLDGMAASLPRGKWVWRNNAGKP